MPNHATKTSFKAGKSGNPAGRPKWLTEWRKGPQAARMRKKAIERLEAILNTDDHPDMVWAIGQTLDRVDGKPIPQQPSGEMEQLQQRKLEAEIKVLEQRAPEGASVDPVAIAAEQQRQLDELRERYPELQSVPGEDIREDA